MENSENINIYVVENVRRDINNNIIGDYNYEIELSGCQKFIILILNILTGGFGTILVPFLNKKRKPKTMIFAGILIGLFQIFHFLHAFSVLTGVKYVEDFYNYISDDKFMELFFDVNNDEDISFQGEDEDKDNFSILKNVIDSLKLNLSETIAKKERIKVLKTLFSIISGMSYCNSLFTACVNFITAKPDSPNYKLGIKILLYNFFNPGVGIILSCFSLFPSCDCSNNKFDIRGIVLSILGIFTRIIVMFCPISLCIGTYLIKLTDKMITIFPIKITFIFIGAIGTFISFVLSAINKKTITEAIKIKINPLDMIIGCGKNFSHLISTFGWASFFRILMNLIIPGSGTFTLLCKYGCSLCIILTSIIQFFWGSIHFY